MADEPRLRSFHTKRFKDQFDRLPAKVQKTALNRYKNYFRIDPFHPLLGRHNLHDVDDAFEDSIAVEMAYGYRAVGSYHEDRNEYMWYWCGTHPDYDGRFRPGW